MQYFSDFSIPLGLGAAINAVIMLCVTHITICIVYAVSRIVQHTLDCIGAFESYIY